MLFIGSVLVTCLMICFQHAEKVPLDLPGAFKTRTQPVKVYQRLLHVEQCHMMRCAVHLVGLA